jgi:biopolymer transport protein ExbD
VSPSHDSGDGDDIVAEINVTPLTDIFLVLLIIFMVTSTAMVQQGAPIHLPEAPSGASLPAGVTVTLTADRTLAVNGASVPMEGLRDALAQALAGTSERSVTLRGDRRVVLEDAVHIMTVAKDAGASKIAIATEPLRRAP